MRPGRPLAGGFRSAPPCGASLALTAFWRYAYSFVTKRVPEKSR
nr:MAG TPA: major coat protein [Bacteriophage sp.]